MNKIYDIETKEERRIQKDMMRRMGECEFP